MFIAQALAEFLDDGDLSIRLLGPNQGGSPHGVKLTIPAMDVDTFADQLANLPSAKKPIHYQSDKMPLVTGQYANGTTLVNLRTAPVQISFVMFDDAKRFLLNRIKQLQQVLVV